MTPVLDAWCARLQLGEGGRLAAARAEAAAAAGTPYTAYLTDLLQAEADLRQQRDHRVTDPAGPSPVPQDAGPVRLRVPTQRGRTAGA